MTECVIRPTTWCGLFLSSGMSTCVEASSLHSISEPFLLVYFVFFKFYLAKESRMREGSPGRHVSIKLADGGTFIMMEKKTE